MKEILSRDRWRCQLCGTVTYETAMFASDEITFRETWRAKGKNQKIHDGEHPEDRV